MTDAAPTELRPLNSLGDVAGDAASPAAVSRLSRALAAPPKGAKAARKVLDLLKASVAALRQRDYQKGSRLALEALKLDDRSGMAWHVLAICREKAGDVGQAITAYEAALKLLPTETAVAHDLGRLAQKLGHFEIAEKLLRKYLDAEPLHVEATNNLACVLRDQGRYGDAIDTLKAIIAVKPAHALLWNSIGTVLSDQGEMVQSIIFFDEALRLDPAFAKARYNRANARMALGDPRSAIADIEQAMTQVDEPFEIETMRMALALTRFMVGDMTRGFDDYQARLSPHLRDAVRFLSTAPAWVPGQDLTGRRLLVFGEQGLGDEVLFANALPDLIEAVGPDGRVVIAVEHRLVPLFRRSFPSADVVRHATVRQEGRLTRAADLTEVGEVDLWAPIGSLFGHVRPTADAFPDRPAFLTPDPDRIAHWHAILADMGPQPKVGVLWKSLKLDGSRRRYFSPFDLWRPVLETPGVTFVNLQYGDCTDELEQARAAGLDLWSPPGIDLKDDLEDVAALCCALDLVVGPANATSNLAAASGATWWAITTPDAWPRFGTDRYPCYPGTQAFPIEGFGEWGPVMERLAQSLAAWRDTRG